MAPLVASLFCALVVFELFRLDPLRGRVSKATWVPFIWLFIAASRNVSNWLRLSSPDVGDPYLEGSPFDRAILSAILLAGVIVLLMRQREVVSLLRSNWPILMFFFYCGISAIWSDFPDVSFKRWFRAMGDVVMVFVVLSDPDWIAALRRLLTRLSFFLLPPSILFIRYFPSWGRSYSKGGAPAWTGVATDKNALGMLSFICGFSALYQLLELYGVARGQRERRRIIAQGSILLMAIYLLYEAHSATAVACFCLAGALLVTTYLFRLARRSPVYDFMVAGAVIVPTSAMFLGLGSGLVQDLGRDTSFTGRTNIWHFALEMVQNPVIGTGYESFWLGPRLRDMEHLVGQTINQAHNGYVEVFLNLGWVGVALLAVLLISGYMRITPSVRWHTQAGSLRLAFLVAAMDYNFSEGGFKMMNPVWFFLLLSIAVLPKAPSADSGEIGTQVEGARGSAPWYLRQNRVAPGEPAKPEPDEVLKASALRSGTAQSFAERRRRAAGLRPAPQTPGFRR